ncbi:MAG: glycosyltransferase [Oscillospiraceae bacterium]|nr:glycosyltransferase [Oscillospiraceae bacterium]MCL2279537.1 glycosyltransferase [Oscillospiraceae bacterium]
MQDTSRPVLSVIIPTFNSEETLKVTLNSLRMQTFPWEHMEIFVIDGGSSDRTLDIAKSFNVIVLENPQRLPAYAIELGFKHANGHYMLRLDSDESFVDECQLEKRFALFDKNPSVKCMGSDKLVSPKFDRKNFSRSYLNIFGEPFSAFVYRKKESIIATYRKKIIARGDGGSCVLKINKNEPYPILDAGATLFSMDYINEHFSKEAKSVDFVLQAAEQIILKTGVVGFIEGDYVVHLPKASFKGYLGKIKFRIINNIYDQKISGYTNVAKNVPILSRRKYLFVLYSLTMICPIFHSFFYSIRHKDPTLLAHFLYTMYTIIMIAYYMCKKLLRLPIKGNKL